MQAERIGPYRIDSRLGSGGMGAVYKAWDERLNRWVAIKSIHPEKALSPERRERLRREARAVAGINHPAVAQVHDVLSEGGREYIVMEYVEGRLLSSLLVRGALPAEQAVDLARQIAEGLHAVHSIGIIHRDLKAENIIVSPGGLVKILDFGLVKRFDSPDSEESLTQEGVVLGTSRAMSPEQAQGERLDHRSDLFSLGSLLYEMVTGRHPFQESTPLETMQRVVHHRPTSVRAIQPDLAPEVALVVEHLLEKDPRNRPADAHEVATALTCLSDLLAGVAIDPAPLERLAAVSRRRRLTRNRWPLVAAAAALVLVAIILVLLS